MPYVPRIWDSRLELWPYDKGVRTRKSR